MPNAELFTQQFGGSESIGHAGHLPRPPGTDVDRIGGESKFRKLQFFLWQCSSLSEGAMSTDEQTVAVGPDWKHLVLSVHSRIFMSDHFRVNSLL